MICFYYIFGSMRYNNELQETVILQNSVRFISEWYIERLNVQISEKTVLFEYHFLGDCNEMNTRNSRRAVKMWYFGMSAFHK